MVFILDESMSNPGNENPPLPSQASDHAWTPSLQESSLEDSPVRSDEEQVPDSGVGETTYQLIQEGSIRAKTKLMTKTGYSYDIRKRSPNRTIDWQCTVHRKDFRCKASVIQRDGKFFPGQHQHSHPGVPGTFTVTEITACMKQIA